MPIVNFNRDIEFDDGNFNVSTNSIEVKSIVRLTNELIITHLNGQTQSISLSSVAGKELIKSIVPENGLYK